MTERWESELQQLRQVSAPPGLQGRVTEGPHGDGMPPAPGRGQRVLAGVVAFAVFGAAMWLAAGGFGGDGPPAVEVPVADTVVVTFDTVIVDPAPDGGRDQYPTATLNVDGRTLEASVGTYNWVFEGVMSHNDTFGTEFDINHIEEWMQVPAGAPIIVQGTADPVTGWVDSCCDRSPWPPVHLTQLGLPDAQLPSDPGRYVLEFHATWPQGRAPFYFPVEVVGTTPTPTPAPGVATIDVQRQPLRAVLTYGDQRQVGGISDTWQPNGDPLEDHRITAPPDLFTFLVVPPGTPLVVNGDLTEWLTFPQPDADPSVLPTESGPVVLTLRGLWRADLAFDASFGLLIAAPGSTVTVPDVVGLGDMGAIRALHAAGLQWTITYEEAPGVKQWTAARSDPAAGTQVPPGSVVNVVVATVITPLPAGSEDALSCPADEHVAFGGPHMRILPGGSAYIVGNLGGIDLRTDEVVQATFRARQWDGIWHVVRDGRVIAVVNFNSLDGVACAGSGVAGV